MLQIVGEPALLHGVDIKSTSAGVGRALLLPTAAGPAIAKPRQRTQQRREASKPTPTDTVRN